MMGFCEHIGGRGLWIAALFLTIILGWGAEARPERSRILVKFETTMGNITLELDKENAPKTVANFLENVEAGHYDGTIFHRVIDGFMIQGGGYDDDLKEKTPASGTVENEADNGLANDQYTVAMARTADPHSARAQFFINVANNTFLNHRSKSMEGWGYAVFGKVVEGQDVVDQIKAVPTRRQGMHENVPETPVKVIKAEVVSQ